jgi:primosomal protein N' (replication factor Y) (superfamily II helicase)
MNQDGTFAEVILPLALPKLYTYSVPVEYLHAARSGSRVIVQFGRRKIYSAVIRHIHHIKPEGYDTKDILGLLDDKPIVSELQMKFWEWVADYYMCTVGEVYKAALPAGLKLESETKIVLARNAEELESFQFSDNEDLLVNILLDNEMLTISEVNKVLEVKDSLRIIKSLLDKGIISVFEQLKQAYKPKFETLLSLHKDYFDETRLKALFDQLSRAPKQLELLMHYVKITGLFAYHTKRGSTLPIRKKELLEQTNVSSQTLNTLIKKGIFVTTEQEIGRLDRTEDGLIGIKKLNEEQSSGLEKIEKYFTQKQVVLLHGVTSSGKTEIYIHLIQKELEKRKQVLYLLPEIALTSQIINRLKSVFGRKTGVYHSKFNDSERVEIWKSVENTGDDDSYQIILGVRSSVYLPFSNLGLIIIDEEHENTYKQFDPAPRYHARDTAIYLASFHKAKVLMGTATPSIESYFNAKSGKYGLVELKKRYSDMSLPGIVIADVRDAQRKHKMKSHFTSLLLENIDQALKNKEQVILFQNRRGFSYYLECQKCGWIPGCKHCDVKLTYHKRLGHLTCHYCGYFVVVPAVCQACGSPNLQTKGFGTEKIEEELPVFFPDTTIARLDLDSTRSKKAYETIFEDFETGKTDILIGTQMVSKGLDFDNVSVVGIINADSLLNFPDFRASERSYQLMAQVSGRAGRKNKTGKVIIQTMQPNHKVITDVIHNNYFSLYQREIAERQMFKYPPFYRLIRVTIKHKDPKQAMLGAKYLAKELKKTFKSRVLGPQEPLIPRIQMKYLQQIIIKIERDKIGKKAKSYILDALIQLKNHTDYRSVDYSIDVDPA